MSKIDEIRSEMVAAMKAGDKESHESQRQRHKGNFIHAACSS